MGQLTADLAGDNEAQAQESTEDGHGLPCPVESGPGLPGAEEEQRVLRREEQDGFSHAETERQGHEHRVPGEKT